MLPASGDMTADCPKPDTSVEVTETLPLSSRTHTIKIATRQIEDRRWEARLDGEDGPQWGRTELESIEHAFIRWTQLHVDSFDTGRITQPPPAMPTSGATPLPAAPSSASGPDYAAHFPGRP